MTPTNDYFRLAAESATDFAILTLDTEGVFNSWNKGSERLLRFAEEEALGQPSGLIFTPEDRAQDAPEKEMETARATGRAEDECWHLRKDGTRFWGSGVMTLLYDDTGVWVGYAKILRDLTERKQLEEALKAVNIELERRVDERTAELRAVYELRRDLLQRLVTAQEDERRRLSRELHDQMGQQLTGLLLGLNNLKTFAPESDAQRIIAQLVGIVKDVTEEVHLISFALRPTALDDLGLLAALRNFTLQWSGWNTIPVDYQLAGWEETEVLIGEKERLPRDWETAIYRIVLEALTNVTRHAKTATGVSLVLQRTESEVRVTVEDNGVGFAPEATLSQPEKRQRLGLFGMQERATLIGGTLTIESEPGVGTSVFLRIPLAARS